MGGACSDNRTSVEKQIQEFLLMLRRMPNLKRYMHGKERSVNFTKAWANPVFGGSVLQPLGVFKKKRTRTNTLEQDIKQCKINALYGGRYYVLEKVQQFREDDHLFLDIYILIENIENTEHLEKVKKLNDKFLETL